MCHDGIPVRGQVPCVCHIPAVADDCVSVWNGSHMRAHQSFSAQLVTSCTFCSRNSATIVRRAQILHDVHRVSNSAVRATRVFFKFAGSTNIRKQQKKFTIPANALGSGHGLPKNRTHSSMYRSARPTQTISLNILSMNTYMHYPQYNVCIYRRASVRHTAPSLVDLVR